MKEFFKNKMSLKVILSIILFIFYLFLESFLPFKYQVTANISVFMISLYQETASKKLSSLGVNICKFKPTCSVYTKEAIIRYGSLKGWALGVYRILRCSPCSKGGYDPLN